MLSMKTIDVAVGLAFLFLGTSFIASTCVEFLSTIRNWRARMLHEAITNMLLGSAELGVNEIYTSPPVIALGRSAASQSPLDFLERFGWRISSSRSEPSYIPAGVFSAAVLQKLAEIAKADISPEGIVAAARKLLVATPEDPAATQPRPLLPPALKSVLEIALITQGDSIQGIRLAIEKWFNDTMDRTSGWYKRRTRAALLTIGLLAALLGNIDAIGVTRWLWQGDAARQAVVAAAEQYVGSHTTQVTPLPKQADTEQKAEATDLQSLGIQVLAIDRQLASLQYPLGWPADGTGLIWLIQYLIGCVITAIAISMGSSFWFDALQGLLKIRSTGPKPGAR